MQTQILRMYKALPSRIKGLLISIISISLLLVFAYCFEQEIILKPGGSPSYKVNRIITQSNKNEISIFGSSRAEQDLDPKILGANYYNYGLASLQDSAILFFVSEELNKHKKTPIIINFDYHGKNTEIQNVDTYIYNIDYSPVKKIVSRKDKYYYHIPFVKYYGLYEFYLKNYIGRRFSSLWYQYEGALIYKKSLPKDEFRSAVIQRERQSNEFVNHDYYRKELTSLINSNSNRKFIFLVAPYHSSFFVKFNGENRALSFLTYLKSFKNVRVINCSRSIFSEDLFFDSIHLNYRGALKYSAMIRDSLANHQ